MPINTQRQAVTPAFIIGSVLESLSVLLFILVFQDISFGPFRFSQYSGVFYTVSAIGFAIGVALLIKDIQTKIELIKAVRKKKKLP